MKKIGEFRFLTYDLKINVRIQNRDGNKTILSN